MTDYTPRSIAQIQRDFADGLSPVDFAAGCFARIERGNDTCKAMIFVGRDEALDDAWRMEAELRSGRKRGPLHGIPIAVKDVIDVKGWPTTSGSCLFRDHVAAEDASCVRNLRAAGALIVGKTNLHELTAGGHENPWFGKVSNPLDPSRGTGGTSSGSAAAVAAGYCQLPLAMRYGIKAYQNEVVMLTKGTAVISVITVIDMTAVANEVFERTYDPFTPMLTVAAFYWFLVNTMRFVFRRLEAHLNRHHAAEDARRNKTSAKTTGSAMFRPLGWLKSRRAMLADHKEHAI